MSTFHYRDNISETLFGKTRRAVLSLLYSHVDDSFYLRQIVRAAGIGVGPVQRELKELSNSGIIQRIVSGVGRFIIRRILSVLCLRNSKPW